MLLAVVAGLVISSCGGRESGKTAPEIPGPTLGQGIDLYVVTPRTGG